MTDAELDERSADVLAAITRLEEWIGTMEGNPAPRENESKDIAGAAHVAIDSLVAEVRRLRDDPTMKLIEMLKATYPGSRLHVFAEDAAGDLPRLAAAERLAEAVIRDQGDVECFEERRPMDPATWDALAAYRKLRDG